MTATKEQPNQRQNQPQQDEVGNIGLSLFLYFLIFCLTSAASFLHFTLCIALNSIGLPALQGQLAQQERAGSLGSLGVS